MTIEYNHILITTDLSELSAVVFSHFRALKSLDKINTLSATLLYVYPQAGVAEGVLPAQATIAASGMLQRGLQDAEKTFEEFFQKYAAGLDITKVLIESEQAVDLAVVEYAKSNQVDLLLLATQGASGFRDFLLGSTAERILKQAPCPLLLVPPTKP